MNKRKYIIESAYSWQYDELIKIHPNLLNYSIEKFPIKLNNNMYYAMTIEIDDCKIVDFCNEFECKSIVLDFSDDLYANYNYPKIIIYDSWIE